MDSDHFACLDGLRTIKDCSGPNIGFAMSYEPQEDDVIIAGYPKSGTTWMQYIVSSIFTSGNPPKTTLDLMLSSPNMEMMGADAVRKMPRPGALKTHIPLHSLKYSTRAKYIYIARNPHDCCVSFYYFINEFTPKDCKELPFDAFFDMFLAGDLLYIDYFDHLLSWYPHRNDPNVLFITYERLKKDTSYWVLRIADFLGEEYGSALRKNEALLNKVLDSCTIENMKTALSDSTNVWIQKALDLPLEKRISSLEVYRNDLSGKEEMPRGGGFVRKGIVGDWKSLFTPAQVERMKATIAEKCAAMPEVMNIWKDLQLPL
ncbi:sulfotransferase ssu-1-like [Amblyomma americanum]